MSTLYRAPFTVGAIVRETLSKGVSKSRLFQQLSEGDPIPLSSVRTVYLKCKDGDESYGGTEGLRWSRRILRQNGLLKGKELGSTLLPSIVDLQLGPTIFAATTPLPIEEISSLMLKEEVVSCCIPLEKGTVVFFPADQDYQILGMDEHKAPFDKLSMDNSIFVDENRDRLKSILKTATTNQSHFRCFKIGDPEVLTCGNEFSEFYLMKMEDELSKESFVKVDKKLGIVFGWGVIATENGQPYFDTQGDHTPDESLLEASADFMLGDRVAGDSHMKDEQGNLITKGTVVFAWPMTKDIAEAFGYPAARTGLMVGLKPSDPEILTKFENGEYTGFSIGGFRIPEFTEEVD